MSLHANIAWSLAGNAVYAACQWGWIVVLAKAGTPEDVGLLALALAVTAPLFMLAGLQLRAVQATDARRRHAFGEYLGLRLALTVAACAGVGVFLLAGGAPREAVPAILVVAVARAFEATSDIYYGLFQQHERMDAVAVSLALRGIASVAVLGAVVAATGSVTAGLAGLAGTWLAVVLVHDVPRAARLASGSRRAIWDPSRLRPLAILALPLGGVTALVSLSANVPRYVLGRLRGVDELGCFAAMASVALVGSVVINAAGQASAPRLALHHAAGNRRAFRRLVWFLLALAALLGAAGILAAWIYGRPILTVLYRPEYATRPAAFVAVMVSGAVLHLASALGYALTAMRRFRIQVPIQIAVTAAVVASCAALVPNWGAAGAAWAATAGAAVSVAGTAWGILRPAPPEASP